MKRAVPTTEKNETEQTKRGRLLMEQKDIKDLEMIEKEEVLEGKQANAALDSLKSNESSSSAIAKTEKMAADTEQGTYPHISASENVQKDTGNKASPQVSASKYVQKIWTCDICQLTMYGSNLNSHLQGKKHKAAYEALNMKTKGTAETDTGNGASPHVSAYKKVQKIWTCGICQFTMISYAEFNSHLQGKKHKAACESLNTKTKATTGTDAGNEASPQVCASENVQKIWTCDICQVTILSYPALNSHLQGKKHKAASEALNTKTEGTAGTTRTCDICQLTILEGNMNSHLQGKKHKATCEALNLKTEGTEGTDTRNGASPHVSASTNLQKTGTCDICQLTTLAGNMNSHLQGKKHKATCEALNTKTEGTAGTDTGNGASPHVSASTNVQKTWTCDICQLTMLEGNMNSHLQGKKHKATCEALKVKSQLVA